MTMFHFRLQQVLDLRQQREKHLATQLVQALDLERAAQHALEGLRAARASNATVVGAGECRSVGELANAALLLQQLDGRIETAHEAVSAASSTVSETKDALTGAHQDRRVLDRLKERDAQSFRVTTDQLERREMDHIALTRYVQNDTE